jgi:hypothetical protein
MKAIQVKYLGCTNHKPSRSKAFAEDGLQVILPYDHSLQFEDNARCAALKLIDKMNWKMKITGEGNLPNGDYVFTIGH